MNNIRIFPAQIQVKPGLTLTDSILCANNIQKYVFIMYLYVLIFLGVTYLRVVIGTNFIYPQHKIFVLLILNRQ